VQSLESACDAVDRLLGPAVDWQHEEGVRYRVEGVLKKSWDDLTRVCAELRRQ
jgi:hypothetical protein